MRCQQYQPILADKCPCEATCLACGRCEVHCFCAEMEDAIRDVQKVYPAIGINQVKIVARSWAYDRHRGKNPLEALMASLNGHFAEEIRVADIATLWDAGILVADDEFDGDKFRA